MKDSIKNIPYRRKRQGRTHYKKRIKTLLSDRPRFVVRKSLSNLHVSLIEYSPKGDKILLTVNSKALAKLGWKADSGNIPSAYLVGFMAGKQAQAKGIKEAILDIGFNNSVKGSRIYATLAGALDSGLSIPADKEILPSKERISGDHIAKFASAMKSDKAKYEKYFSVYLKKGLQPENLVSHFNETKVKIK
ncbi:MAG TPA: 50S ribosomal protein L18 [Candidatus Nanoarchaeia archaeon]|nr:50S ribosomal protein L18 [Candidatus Nanoarchaeia archaeon]